MTALIWDLDGTLLDSYRVIVESTRQTLAEAGVSTEYRALHRRLIETSVMAVLRAEAEPRGLDADALWRRYRALSVPRDGEIGLMPGAREALQTLSQMGAHDFVYTHKGDTAGAVLDRLGIGQYFEYILTAEQNLPRKPAPDGINWLADRFGLDKAHTLYVGDRPIDVDCAEAAGVRCILYIPPASPGAPTGREFRVVRELTEIPEVVY